MLAIFASNAVSICLCTHGETWSKKDSLIVWTAPSAVMIKRPWTLKVDFFSVAYSQVPNKQAGIKKPKQGGSFSLLHDQGGKKSEKS